MEARFTAKEAWDVRTACAVCHDPASARRLSDAQPGKRMKGVKVEKGRVRPGADEEEPLSSTDGREEAARHAAITRPAICEGRYPPFRSPAAAHALGKKVIPEPELFPIEHFIQKKTGRTWERLDA